MSPNRQLDSQKIRRLLVRSTNWIGDAVMTTPALARLRSLFPRAEITLVAKPLVAELFTPHPHCDRVLVYDRRPGIKDPAAFLRFCRRLRREKFDLAVLFQNAFEAALMARLAGIPRRAGYATDGRGWLLTHRVPLTTAHRRLHHTDYYLALLAGLGLAAGEKPALTLSPTGAELRAAAARLGPGHWVAVNPGASYGAAKRWFPERFAAVAEQLITARQVKIVLIGGPGEREIGRDIVAACRRPLFNLIGETTVRQMMAIIATSRLLITNDSGPMHVAAAVGTPIVAIFGPTDVNTTSPLAPDCLLLHHEIDCAPCLQRQCSRDHQCMRAVTAAEVYAAANTLLERNT